MDVNFVTANNWHLACFYLCEITCINWPDWLTHFGHYIQIELWCPAGLFSFSSVSLARSVISCASLRKMRGRFIPSVQLYFRLFFCSLQLRSHWLKHITVCHVHSNESTATSPLALIFLAWAPSEKSLLFSALFSLSPDSIWPTKSALSTWSTGGREKTHRETVARNKKDPDYSFLTSKQREGKKGKKQGKK